MVYDSFSQRGMKDLKGNFKEVNFYRNEQNTGPVVRIYTVTIADTIWDEMETYGDYMPYTKYGNTKVYYFLNSTRFGKVTGRGDADECIGSKVLHS